MKKFTLIFIIILLLTTLTSCTELFIITLFAGNKTTFMTLDEAISNEGISTYEIKSQEYNLIDKDLKYIDEDYYYTITNLGSDLYQSDIYHFLELYKTVEIEYKSFNEAYFNFVLFNNYFCYITYTSDEIVLNKIPVEGELIEKEIFEYSSNEYLNIYSDEGILYLFTIEDNSKIYKFNFLDHTIELIDTFDKKLENIKMIYYLDDNILVHSTDYKSFYNGDNTNLGHLYSTTFKFDNKLLEPKCYGSTNKWYYATTMQFYIHNIITNEDTIIIEELEWKGLGETIYFCMNFHSEGKDYLSLIKYSLEKEETTYTNLVSDSDSKPTIKTIGKYLIATIDDEATAFQLD